jgi:hypothetical protein
MGIGAPRLNPSYKKLDFFTPSEGRKRDFNFSQLSFVKGRNNSAHANSISSRSIAPTGLSRAGDYVIS